jgi:outer membrane protein assembly factor BamB
MESPWATFGMYWSAAAYNLFYFGSYDGYLYAFNATDGTTVWKHFFGYTSQTAAGVYIPWAGGWVADGKIVVGTCEHSPAVPYPKGNYLTCLDALTGNEIWTIKGFQGQTRAAAAGISSGMFWFANQYDGSVYNFGKGESATTVTAPTTSVPLGTGVLIQGTVTDQSPGLKNTPAISDASMSDWMEYMYTQNEIFPSNATGVPVLLQAVSSDGTITDIGRTTSDVMGSYEIAWNPTKAGTYKILASFAGSGSYYASSDECALLVGLAASAAPIVTPTPPQPTASPIVTPTPATTPTPTTPQGPGGLPASTIYAVSAALVVIIIVAVAAAVLLRRKQA